MAGGALPIVGSVVGGIAQGGAARRAARAQERAAAEDLAFQRETRDTVRNDFAPYREGGGAAFDAYLFEMGLGNRPTIGGTPMEIETIPGGTVAPTPGTGGQPATGPMGLPAGFNLGNLIWGNLIPDGNTRRELDTLTNAPATAAAPTQYRVGDRTFGTMEDAQAYANANRTGGRAYGGFQRSQDYLFGLREGTSAVEASAAARGGLFSGAAMRDLNTYAQDYGSQRRGEYLNRLAGIADAGQAAAGASGNASMSAAGNVSNALAARGNATAAGAIGVGNAINSGIGNALGAWNYQQQWRPTSGPGSYGGGR